MNLGNILSNVLKGEAPKANEAAMAGLRKIVIVGNPNVGKSVLFGRLTGAYATVSNYPGTTVEVFHGTTKIGAEEFHVIDTPGMYGLLPITEEERVARKILLEEKPCVVIHVIDAKNIERMLPLAFQLMEARLRLVLVLNMFDEAQKLGMKINVGQLDRDLKIPVAATVSTTGKGVDVLRGKIEAMSAQKYNEMGDVLEISLEKIAGLLQGDYGLSGRCVALLMLQDDEEIITLVRRREPKAFAFIELIIEAVKDNYSQPLSYIIAMRRQEEANRIVAEVVEHLPSEKLPFGERLSRVMISPMTGVPFLLLVLYFGLYKFVGQFGAGTLVNFIEADIFERHINPYIAKIFENYIPWQVVRDLFVGEYGMVTLGLRYAVALILPIVTTFFIVFAIIEDSGYLPRLALLIDRLFKKIGLTGRAVIPMVLGLGCDTMATMVTRTLPTKRERLIATILLALAVPCSAQLGVILALLSGNATALWIWGFIVVLVFLLIGFLSSKILPGDAPSFYMEIPPLRLPKISNVIIKTYTRVKWYFIEIMPMFIFASFLIWLGLLTGVFGVLTKILEYPVHWAGLPDKAAVSFLFGFFRRDYGAGGLYFMQKEGLLNGNQLLVACVTLTLFLPCVAQFLMNVKERGLKTGVAISSFILAFSFSVGAAVNVILTVLGIHL